MRSSFRYDAVDVFACDLLTKGSEATITRLYGKVQLLVNPFKARDHHHMPSTREMP